jgi:hypothetical protein
MVRGYFCLFAELLICGFAFLYACLIEEGDTKTLTSQHANP